MCLLSVGRYPFCGRTLLCAVSPWDVRLLVCWSCRRSQFFPTRLRRALRPESACSISGGLCVSMCLHREPLSIGSVCHSLETVSSGLSAFPACLTGRLSRCWSLLRKRCCLFVFFPLASFSWGVLFTVTFITPTGLPCTNLKVIIYILRIYIITDLTGKTEGVK